MLPAPARRHLRGVAIAAHDAACAGFSPSCRRDATRSWHDIGENSRAAAARARPLSILGRYLRHADRSFPNARVTGQRRHARNPPAREMRRGTGRGRVPDRSARQVPPHARHADDRQRGPERAAGEERPGALVWRRFRLSKLRELMVTTTTNFGSRMQRLVLGKDYLYST